MRQSCMQSHVVTLSCTYIVMETSLHTLCHSLLLNVVGHLLSLSIAVVGMEL